MVLLASGKAVQDGKSYRRCRELAGSRSAAAPSLRRRQPAYIQTVMRTLLSRLNALLLVALMLCGGGSMPLLDAISHGDGSGSASGPHFETASAALSHRDFCSLGASLPFSTHRPALDFDIALGVVAFPDVGLHAAAPRSADRDLLPQPRAPPSLSA